MSRFLPVHTMEDLEGLIRYTGLLPLFTCSIPGFSIEENCAPEIWFSDDREGPWEWKGPIARKGEIFYGKFCENKAVFVHRDLFPGLISLHRDGYDFDTLWELGMAGRAEHSVMRVLSEEGSLLSPDLKKKAGFGKGGYKNFDQVMTKLQLRGYVCIKDFEQRVNKQGEPYGWHVTRFTTPEAMLGTDVIEAAYEEPAARITERIVSRLVSVMPDVSREAIINWLTAV